MWIADLFSPAREQQFFILLAEHASILARAAAKLDEFARHGTPALADDIRELERAADQILERTTTALRDAFITPLDRQDIYNLSETIDDMIDYLDNAAAEISLFGVTVTPFILTMTSTLRHAADEIAAAVRLLTDDPRQAWRHSRNAQAAENAVEDCYRSALADLFRGDDVQRMFKLREVYRHLSNSADRAEAIGRLIGKIVVKVS